MKTIGIYLSLNLILFLSGCTSENPDENENSFPVTNNSLVDPGATAETVALYGNLQQLASEGVMFGHQDDLAYGIGWWAEPGRSDIKDVCGDYPAVYGWDLGDIQNEDNLDGVNFSKMIDWIREAYDRGGIITISMHLDNPVTGENAWDNTEAVSKILPGKSHHMKYLATLDMIADFLEDLKTSTGTYIPVILRPYHEHNHTWSWWGAESCTAEEYNALWKMTVEYLRDDREVHHLLYVISPQEIESTDDYLKRYPGDDYVDILGLDYYKLWDISSVTDLGKTLATVATLAEQRGKVSALTEVGIENVPISDWWTNYLLEGINYNDQSKKTAWALVWRNASKDHHFAPYPGHASEEDFLNFFSDPFTVFENDLPDMYE
ncbi:MAG: glycosyl hydrolase [Candidatus Neomarinimicrobiota bacterium]